MSEQDQKQTDTEQPGESRVEDAATTAADADVECAVVENPELTLEETIAQLHEEVAL